MVLVFQKNKNRQTLSVGFMNVERSAVRGTAGCELNMGGLGLGMGVVWRKLSVFIFVCLASLVIISIFYFKLR